MFTVSDLSRTRKYEPSLVNKNNQSTCGWLTVVKKDPCLGLSLSIFLACELLSVASCLQLNYLSFLVLSASRRHPPFQEYISNHLSPSISLLPPLVWPTALDLPTHTDLREPLRIFLLANLLPSVKNNHKRGACKGEDSLKDLPAQSLRNAFESWFLLDFLLLSSCILLLLPPPLFLLKILHVYLHTCEGQHREKLHGMSICLPIFLDFVGGKSDPVHLPHKDCIAE